jgi:hypothetical protein
MKQRRHAIRLMLNLDEMLATGRFNPAMTEFEKETCETITAMDEKTYFWFVDRYLGREDEAGTRNL